MCLWRGSKIHADTSSETQSNEQPNHDIHRKISCDANKVFWYTYISLSCLLVSSLFWYDVWKSHHEPDTHIRFSIISVPVSELNPNASSTPFFSIVFQAAKAFENGTEMCLNSISTTISYQGIKIARAAKDESLYYIENYWSEFVIPVPMLASVLRYLQKQLWEESEREIVVLDLEMDFQADDDDKKNYHVWCNNVTLRAFDTPIPCNVTM